MSSATPAAPPQPLSRKAKSIPVQTFEVSPDPLSPRLKGPPGGVFRHRPGVPSQVKLDVTLGDLTKIGKSQKYTLSVDVEGGKLVVLKKQKDSQEDWNTFTHDKSEGGACGGGDWGGGSLHLRLAAGADFALERRGSVPMGLSGGVGAAGCPHPGCPSTLGVPQSLSAGVGGARCPAGAQHSPPHTPHRLSPLSPSPAADQVTAGAEQTGHRFREGKG